MVTLCCNEKRCDWIEIFDGVRLGAPQIGGRICGNSLPETVISSSNELMVRFWSDASVGGIGYKILVEEIGKIIKWSCNCLMFSPDPNRIDIMGNSYSIF